jgi:hypothetical protein
VREGTRGERAERGPVPTACRMLVLMYGARKVLPIGGRLADKSVGISQR